MLSDNDISDHYIHGNLLAAIEAALTQLGRSADNVTIEDLAPVDEFHIGGRQATKSFLSQLNISEQDHLLDIGCGLGGASRYVANKHNNRITGIDLTEEYIETGNVLCAWVNLEKQISLHQGSALSIPFQDESFDGAYMMHVGMNIEDKAGLFKEISRVLKPGASFGIYDVMQDQFGKLSYPVPWAASEKTSFVTSPDQYRHLLENAGFKVIKENNLREFALDFFETMRAKTKANGGPPPLGLETVIKTV